MIRALEPEEASLDEHAGLLLSEREIDEGNLPVASEGVTRHRRASVLPKWGTSETPVQDVVSGGGASGFGARVSSEMRPARA